MGLPNISISFKELAVSTISRGSKGTVVLVLNHTKEDAEQSIHTLYRFNDLNELDITLTSRQKLYIQLAFLGADNPPEKVILVMRGQADEDYSSVFNTLETLNFSYIAFPEGEEQLTNIEQWIRDSENIFIAILNQTRLNSEKVVNFASETIYTNLDEEPFTGFEFTSRIAGLLAGTKLNKSATYSTLSEVDAFEYLSKTDMDTAINNGKFILYYDGEKTKVARAVTSFTETDSEKGDSFKKIKLVEAMQMIKQDIKRTCEDTYIGKYTNTYSNKCILITAINSYFDELAKDNVLNPDSVNICEIDLESQRAYLKSKGVDVDSLSDEALKKYDTDDKVFLSANISLLDAIEDITLEITI